MRARPYLDAPRPLLFAHRGGAAVAPENTLLAFRRALELGYRYIETDVHLTRDGELVTIHDPTLARTTDGRGMVRAHTLAELRRFDAGHNFTADGGRTFPFRGQGLQIPTLAELLELSPELRVNIEIKERDPAAQRALWAFARRHDVVDRILVGSEHAPVLRSFRALTRGAIATSAGRDEVLRFWLATRLRLGPRRRPPYDALQIPPREGRLTVVDRRLLDAAHRLGIHVHVWTINEADEMRRLLALGVDGVMTDYPARLLEIAGA